MLYVKNVPGFERVLRVAAGIAAAVLAMLFLAAPLSWMAAASAIGISLTGLFGFCPACAMVGRRLKD
ncbi:MAG: DUF2892 domain-containing protein [Pseudomonadota bacterium]